MHIAMALLKAGQRVATIDLDCRQRSFTRYINNRSTWSRRTSVNLELPVHSCIKLGETMQIADNENAEYQQFADAIQAVERTFDFIVIDTPGTDSYLMRLAQWPTRWALFPRDSPVMPQPAMRSYWKLCDALPFSTTRRGSSDVAGWSAYPSIAVISISFPDRREGQKQPYGLAPIGSGSHPGPQKTRGSIDQRATATRAAASPFAPVTI
jgi:hypothetical protein